MSDETTEAQVQVKLAEQCGCQAYPLSVLSALVWALHPSAGDLGRATACAGWGLNSQSVQWTHQLKPGCRAKFGVYGP